MSIFDSASAGIPIMNFSLDAVAIINLLLQLIQYCVLHTGVLVY